MCVPERVRGYLDALAAAVREALGASLVGVYTTGSVALGDYLPGSSDIDVAVVAADATPRDRLVRLGERIQHGVLPSPARGLELVVHAHSAAAGAATHAGYLLEVNTGAELAPLLRLDPAGRPRHWYVIDRMIARQCGHALAGPRASTVFAPVPRACLLRIVAEAVADRSSDGDPGAEASAVLDACRARYFTAYDRWIGKQAAGEWALRHGTPSACEVRRALDLRLRTGR